MLIDWPPALPDEKLAALSAISIDWALAHGLCVTAPKQMPPNTTHAPFALYPSPFPKSCYDKAQKLQPIYNSLVHSVSQNHKFLKGVIETLSDPFTSRLYNIYKQTVELPIQQPITLGIHRSDYLLDGANEIKQVELNTIASSFSCLSSITAKLHSFLSDRTDFYNSHSPGSLDINSKMFPENVSGTAIPGALAKAFELYGVNDAVVLMVIQSGERNIFDQRHVEFALFEMHKIKMIRRTLGQIEASSVLAGPNKNLLFIDGMEIAVTYFRAGYTPNDYLSEKEWDARLLIEKSFTIKCPNIAYHLVGSKKVQQVLASPNVIEMFITSSEDISLLKSSFTGLYPLDDSKEGLSAYNRAMVNPMGLVLKPQREGGGNNFYNEDVRKKLKEISAEERNSFILMDLIQPPRFKNLMMREGVAHIAEVVSELGIYGVWISSSNGDIILNECAGHLMRTKSSDSDEGGVASGFAVLDSPFLI